MGTLTRTDLNEVTAEISVSTETTIWCLVWLMPQASNLLRVLISIEPTGINRQSMLGPGGQETVAGQIAQGYFQCCPRTAP